MFYKIIQNCGRSYIDCDYAVDYKPKTRTIPKIGKLFVFDTQVNAEHFFCFTTNSKHGLWSCFVTNPQPINLVPVYPWEYESFWLNFPKINPQMKLFTAPQGTIVCDSVTIREKIC